VSSSSLEEDEVCKSDDSLEDLVTVTIEFKIIVRDTGIGIKKENIDKLFQYFGKLSSSQESNKSGVGLGLTISRDLVHAFGGKI